MNVLMLGTVHTDTRIIIIMHTASSSAESSVSDH